MTPTRNPYYDVEATIEQLDDPVTDAHGNEVTERTSSIVYTARTPLPDGQRDTFELSFQVPDAEGEVLSFPTIQTCEKGETAWTAGAGRRPGRRRAGEPGAVLHDPARQRRGPPRRGGRRGDRRGGGRADVGRQDAVSDEADDDGSSALGWAGLVAGLLGLAAGGLALARTRSTP